MDGNGRWAQQRGWPRIEGHRSGAKSVRAVVEESRKLGVEYLTLFAFSSENWGRPKEEVGSLMRLFEQYLMNEIAKLKKNGVRLRVIGDLERLPEPVVRSIGRAEEETSKNSDLTLILAVSYGGRDEIAYAARALAKRVQAGELDPKEITADSISSALYAPDVPDPDLLIRTSAEHRISNFLLWQVAYSELVITPVLWPDFDADQYRRCLEEYAQRDRRFGLTADQVA